MSEPTLRTSGGTPLWIHGTGPLVLLVHGVLMDHRMWAPQVKALAARYTVCTIDMLGHGRAPDPPGERRLADFVEQVEEAVACLADRGAPVLGGFSMGGLVAQAYAVQNPEKLRGLMVLNAVYDRSPEESAIVRARSRAMREGGVESAVASAESRWFTQADRTDRAAAVAAIISWMRDGEFGPKAKAHRVFSEGDAEVAGRLAAVHCPALVMTGDGDAGSTPAMARSMGAALRQARVEILDGQRHMMPYLDAARVNGVIDEFLASL